MWATAATLYAIALRRYRNRKKLDSSDATGKDCNYFVTIINRARSALRARRQQSAENNNNVLLMQQVHIGNTITADRHVSLTFVHR